MLAKKADRVLVCFEQAKKLLGGDEKIILTGAPVRGEILAASREKARAKFGLGENDQLVVSFWGSMGAKYMNEHMAGTLALECKNGVSYLHVHATGAAARDWLPKMAREQGADFENHPNIQYTEYIYDMADRMAAADLIVCRAGAATLGELCMLGRSCPLRSWRKTIRRRTREPSKRRAAAACCSKRTPRRRSCMMRSAICCPTRCGCTRWARTRPCWRRTTRATRSTARSSGRSKTTASKAEHA